jgi:hypothetical protein
MEGELAAWENVPSVGQRCSLLYQKNNANNRCAETSGILTP